MTFTPFKKLKNDQRLVVPNSMAKHLTCPHSSLIRKKETCNMMGKEKNNGCRTLRNWSKTVCKSVEKLSHARNQMLQIQRA